MAFPQIYKVYISGTRKQLEIKLGLEKSNFQNLIRNLPNLSEESKKCISRSSAYPDSLVIFLIAQFNNKGAFELKVTGYSPKKRQSRKATAKEFVNAVLVHKLTGSTDIWNHLYQELSK